MKTRYLFILLAFILPFAGFGQMGETREECDKRYGAPTQIVADGHVFYQQKDLRVIIGFDASNHVGQISYDRLPAALSETEIQGLMKACANEDWLPFHGPDTNYVWYVAPLVNYTACVTLDRLVVIIVTPDYVKYNDARRRAARAHRLDGF